MGEHLGGIREGVWGCVLGFAKKICLNECLFQSASQDVDVGGVVTCVYVLVRGGELLYTNRRKCAIAQPFNSNHVRDAGGSGGNMASYFGRQQSAASMASLPPDEVEFELDLEVRFNLMSSLLSLIMSCGIAKCCSGLSLCIEKIETTCAHLCQTASPHCFKTCTTISQRIHQICSTKKKGTISVRYWPLFIRSPYVLRWVQEEHQEVEKKEQ